MINIYLAGGWKDKQEPGWQEKIISLFTSRTLQPYTYGQIEYIQYYNPKARKTDNPDVYTWADLQEIGCSDIVFVCLEESNPAGQGLALEVGYAFKSGIPIVMFDGRPSCKWFGMVRTCATVVSTNYDESVENLWQMCLVLENQKHFKKE